jgi:hypothetical protein
MTAWKDHMQVASMALSEMRLKELFVNSTPEKHREN